MSIEAMVRGDGKVVVVKGGDRLREGRLTAEGVRELHPVEAAYLLYIGKLRLREESGRELSLEDMFKIIRDDNLWILFVVYTDLRRKGKRVRLSHTPRMLYVEHGDKVIEMLVLEENTMVPSTDIVEFVRRAISRGFEPMIAVVDMYGDITYYEVSKISFKPIERVWPGYEATS